MQARFPGLLEKTDLGDRLYRTVGPNLPAQAEGIGRRSVSPGTAVAPQVVGTAAERQIYPEASRFFIPSLDGIRAFAFLIVFLRHAGWVAFPAAFGVTIFFFLSGYLITTLLRREADRTGDVDLAAFYVRRVLRILPPFYLVLATALLVQAWIDPTKLHWRATMALLGHLTNYYAIFGNGEEVLLGTTVAWSLAVEEHFYLLFPLVYIGLRRWFGPRGQATAILILCALILGWRCTLVYGLGADNSWIYRASDCRADAILFGCILAVTGNPMMDRAGATRRRVDLILVPVALLCIGASWAVSDDRFHETFRYTLQSLAMIPLFTAAIRYPEWPPFRILNCRPVRFVGVLSYSLYLIHLSIIEWLSPVGMTRISTTIVSLAVSMALAYAVHLWVELPCAKLRRRLYHAA